MKLDLRDYRKIVVFQYSKVGSSSLCGTLAKKLRCQWKHHDRIRDRYPQRILHLHLPEVFKDILAKSKGEKVLVITVCRNVYLGTISGFFQNIKYFCQSNDKGEILKAYFDNPEAFIDVYLRRIHFGIKKDSWFRHIEKACRVKLYRKFDFSRRALVSKAKDGNAVLLLRFEDIGDWRDILRDVFGLDRLRMVRRNVSKEKWYHGMYADMRKRIRFTKGELAKYRRSRHARFYYTKDEVQGQFQRED